MGSDSNVVGRNVLVFFSLKFSVPKSTVLRFLTVGSMRGVVHSKKSSYTPQKNPKNPKKNLKNPCISFFLRI